MKRFIICLALLIIAAPLFATVRGKVVRADNAAAYSGVAVKIEGNGKSFTGYTDEGGQYYVHDVPAGRYRLTVSSARDTKSIPVNVTRQPYTDVVTVTVR
ncbi:MAG: hypothetical protein JWN02_1787 [Acidobacteria bacterium]|nr:hypothetical protein [Acidobacteriota bacterium]